ncbi:hypothetical protein IEO21_07182 [Rhodonia placenta]|uniref:ABC transmembrane type-1 domain-containing protein n=1 Tax=Rhodonia placenta TaxID=104341 RepID=A0A8H7NYP3_9APHY|nr:hypothetical protein IEO21_07182 [Postia placenta]
MSSQTLLGNYNMAEDPQGTLWDTRFIAVYIAAISLVALILENLYRSRRAKRLYSNLIAFGTPSPSSGSVVFGSSDSADAAELRAPPSLSRRFIRLNAEQEDRTESTGQPASLEIVLCGTYAYVSLLSLATLVARPKTSGRVTRYLVLILLSAWVTYVYRDIWPYATFDLTPADAFEGIYLWTKIVFLTLAAVLVPLFSPRRYVPSVSKTASLASLMFFTWIDPIVFKAYRVPHLSVDELPPLADYDDSESLVNSHIKELDPLLVRKKGQHIGWGLLKVFRNDFIVMGTMLTLNVIARFVSPIAVRNLLAYLEGSSDTTVRPWVWVGLLFVGPILTVLFISMYLVYCAGILVRVEALVTQLVFTHALRMRVKSEVSETPAPQASTASTVAPDDEGTSSAPGVQNASTNNTKGKQRASSNAPKQAQLGTASQRSKNFVGRINNLITTDLQSLATGRDVLHLFVMVPVQTFLCVWFLYSVLGWSAFVGMAVIVLLLPVPGSVAKMIRGVQVEKMKKTDARVQGVTEAMNVIRMIKLFGWERRITDQLTEKREVELKSVKRAKLLQMISSSLTIEGVLIDDRLTSTVFDMFTLLLNQITNMLTPFIRAKVSLDRLNEFLQTTELLDEFAEQQEADVLASMLKNDVPSDLIGFCDAMFTWTKEDSLPSSTGSSSRNFTLCIENELVFKQGRINLIIGPTGSGKTSLLMALLGESGRYPVLAYFHPCYVR